MEINGHLLMGLLVSTYVTSPSESTLKLSFQNDKLNQFRKDIFGFDYPLASEIKNLPSLLQNPLYDLSNIASQNWFPLTELTISFDGASSYWHNCIIQMRVIGTLIDSCSG